MRSHKVAWTAAILSLAVAAWADASQSADPAGRLVRTLRERKIQHVAAKDPAEPGRYVAAMLAGDGLLLVVSGRYAQPVLLNERLFKGDYQGVYMELNAAADRDGRFFVQDLGRPGLHATREDGAPFDVVYESVADRTAFDGDWKAQKLSRDAYARAYDQADARYARTLETLLAAVAAPAATTAAR
jgi:hypothetical protein